MGHSTRSVSVVGGIGFKLGGQTKIQAVNNYIESIKSKNSIKVVNCIFRYVVPFLPNGSAKMPLYYGIRRGIKFLNDVEKSGFKKAAQNLTLNVVKGEIVHTAVDLIWDSIEDDLLETKRVDKSLARFSEGAFKKTMNEIIIRGIDAL